MVAETQDAGSDLTEVEEPVKAVHIEVTVAPKLSLALQQNAVPIVRELRIQNATETDYRDLRLTISSDPGFLVTRTWTIDRLKADHTASINNVKLDFVATFLENLEEAVPGRVEITLTQGEVAIATCSNDIRLLAKHEWGGVSDLPEIIAAFVQPNDAAVAVILRDASKALEKANFPAALDGYQSGNPRRSALIASAIWSALVKQDLSYAVNPASFELEGQKIRLPSVVLHDRLATCLDLACLYASCLEQAGLHPLIFFAKEHAFVGCWLVDTDFSRVAMEDPQAFRKRVDLKEMIAIETTMVTQRPPGKFKFAVAEGRKHLQEESPVIGIDIHRSRSSRILPLSDPNFERFSKAADAEEVSAALDIPDDIPPEPTNPGASPEELPLDSAEGRLAHWKRKLLDLSLRNPLLNYHAKRRAVTFVAPEPGLLEDKIADGERLRVDSVTKLFAAQDPRAPELHLQQRMEELEKEQILAALNRNDLLATEPAESLSANLVELYRAARAALQEGGANILYLAFGFLEWKRDAKESRSHRAPLILVPVELSRRSAVSGFKLSLLDDEPRLNPTLLQMLSQDFEVEFPEFKNELPKDAHGLDIEGIWRTIRQSIKDIEGWEVHETVVLSTFSFAKYLMWVDLEARTDLLKLNPIVAHLIDSPRDPFRAGLDLSFIDPEKLDEVVEPADVFMPLEADSSQMSAALSAASGKDFVLEGPPGTGKSQTIANIIGQCLADGRTVLFVAEKTAALEVVYRRLEELGVGSFCLELHSHKARKTQVLQQLEHAWNSHTDFTANWASTAGQVKDYRDRLNAYVGSLHRRANNGLTPFVAFGIALQNADVAQVEFSWPSPDIHDEQHLNRLKDICGRLDVNLHALGKDAFDALRYIERTEWSPAWQTDLIHHSQALADAAQACRRAIRAFCESTSIKPTVGTIEQLHALAELAGLLPEAANKPYQFAFGKEGGALLQDLNACAEHISKHGDAWNALSVRFQRNAVELPLEALSEEWSALGSKWFLLKWFGRRRIRRILEAYSEQKLKNDSVIQDLANLVKAREQADRISSVEYLKNIFPRNWDGLDTDVAFIKEAHDWGARALTALGRLTQTPLELGETRTSLQAVLSDGQLLIQSGGAIAVACDQVVSAFAVFETTLQEIARLAATQNETLFAEDTEDYLANVQAICAAWAERKTDLRDWCAWRSACEEAESNGIGSIATALIREQSVGISAAKLFEVNYCRWWSAAHVEKQKELREFIPAEHARVVDLYRDADQELRDLTRELICARLSGSIPSPESIAPNSEWTVLTRELQKKGRHMPLRQLVSKLPDALTQLTPCVMMSPMSIAQYLPPDRKLFDLVIFDEASQIPTWDAIGAIARGKQAVIVGDPKQLPPTSFFERRDSEYADEDVEVEDLESILDECLGANLPMRRLNWHYRSRCESLIAFSNWHYYDGRLVTFPANDTNKHSLTFTYIEGAVYARGGARTNQKEAKAVVDEIVSLLSDPGFEETIGVVTFNSQQERLLEDLLDDARRKHPEIEPHFSDSTVEPVFVKNLESVQGDERDRMYFSVTYGPDITGKTSMHFGPMNQAGGPRRLNVAITRARNSLHVFSSIRPDDIDLSRTASEGVRDLKHFLEYAERGHVALGEAVDAPTGDFDSPFEQEVAERLRRAGWNVHVQVGVSGFRIDLAIVHPDAPGRYLAGIECDGATYHRAATARDRDLLREKILIAKGWRIERIWSTDWWVNSGGALEKVTAALNVYLAADRALAEEKPDSIEEPTTGDSALAVDVSEQAAGEVDVDVPELAPDRVTQQDEPREIESDPDSVIAEGGDSSETPQSIFDGDHFFDAEYTDTLRGALRSILESQAPIRLDSVVRQIARLHGFQRAGGRIQQRLTRLISSSDYKRIKEGGHIFIWPKDKSPETWTEFRPPSSELRRTADELPLAELVALARQVMPLELSDDEAIREMAHRLGFSTLRGASRVRAGKALAMSKGDISE